MSAAAAETARVHLVGAGPGDPDLLTVKARRLIESADVVVFDRLVSDAVLALIPRGAMRICVGKQPQRHPVPQDEINEMLVRLAKPGRVVVRLKGGDPFMFGRGSEEAEHLAAAGVGFEVVPGITAAAGAAASLGLPLTHRGLARSVRFVTGHCRADEPLDLDWPGLADPQTTLVVYMGLAQIDEIVAQLRAHGMPAGQPCAVIANATQPGQRQIFSTLEELPAAVRSAGLTAPVLFIIGAVVEVGRLLGRVQPPPATDTAMQAG